MRPIGFHVCPIIGTEPTKSQGWKCRPCLCLAGGRHKEVVDVGAQWCPINATCGFNRICFTKTGQQQHPFCTVNESAKPIKLFTILVCKYATSVISYHILFNNPLAVLPMVESNSRRKTFLALFPPACVSWESRHLIFGAEFAEVVQQRNSFGSWHISATSNWH